jgi:hypothetical protein
LDALGCWDALGDGPLALRLRGLVGRVVARELPIVLPPVPSPADGDARAVGFVSGSIDLLYRDEDDRLVVVDYKTDRLELGEDPGARRERYARQGELYCRAVGAALGADPPPRFEIWWLRSGAVDAIPDPRATGGADR